MDYLLHDKNLVFVSSRRTGDVTIRRARDPPRHSRPLFPRFYPDKSSGRSDQLSDSHRTNPKEHHENLYLNTSDAQDSDAYLITFKCRYELDSCGINDLIERFHYISKRKDEVCRCPKHDHRRYRTPKNAQIIQRCVDFFITHPKELTCTRKEWRSVYNTAELTHPSEHELSLGNDCAHRTKDRDLKQAPDIRHLSPSPKMKSQKSFENNTVVGEMPKEVWRSARSSEWKALDPVSQSLTSTPLGSIAAPVFPGASLKAYKPSSQNISDTYYKRSAQSASPNTIADCEQIDQKDNVHELDTSSDMFSNLRLPRLPCKASASHSLLQKSSSALATIFEKDDDKTMGSDRFRISFNNNNALAGYLRPWRNDAAELEAHGSSPYKAVLSELEG